MRTGSAAHGSHPARQRLIERHIPLARRLAMRYRRASEPVDDLVQVASLGLVKAVDRWDPDRGFAFSTYAVPTILGELRRYFRDATWDVRPPRPVQELCLSVDRARNELYAALGREPTIADLAARLRREPAEIVEALQAGEGRLLRSLDMPARDEGYDEAYDSASIGDQLGYHDGGYERAETRDAIDRLTAVLDDTAREVVRLRFEEDLSQSEIAERLGCSQMQVSRVLRRSLEKLSAYASHAFLRDAA